MNEEKLRKLAEQAGLGWDDKYHWYVGMPTLIKFVETIKQEIYNQVKEELVDDDAIDEESDIEDRCYLRGCNGGTVDALIHIKNFLVDLDE